MEWFTSFLNNIAVSSFISNFTGVVMSAMDAVFSFLFTYLWLPDLFPAATAAIQSAMVSLAPIFLGLNTIFPVLLLFQILAYIFEIEIAVIMFKIGLLIIRLIRG